MRDAFESILSYDELTPEERESLHRELEADPQLKTCYRQWRALSGEVRRQLDEALPDREVLVLMALSRSGVPLSASETTRLEAARPALEKALQEHPVLEDVSTHIQQCGKDFSRLWEEAAPSVARRDRPARALPPRNRLIGRIAGVAALVLLSVVGGVSLWRSNNLVVIRTDAGETRDVVFSDGSSVRLHGKSSLSYRKRDTTSPAPAIRTVSLRGQAFFHVIPGSEAFTVETPAAFTRAIGTSFSVESNLAETRVILAQGQVSVSARRWSRATVTLNPGEMSHIQGLRSPTAPQRVEDMTHTLRWSGYLVFHETPLREVAQHLARTYETPVDIPPPLAEERFSATLSPDSLTIDQAMELLATAFAARVEQEGTAYRLVPPRPQP